MTVHYSFDRLSRPSSRPRIMQSRTKNVFAEVNIVIKNLPRKLFVDILQTKISSCARDVKDEIIFMAVAGRG